MFSKGTVVKSYDHLMWCSPIAEEAALATAEADVAAAEAAAAAAAADADL